MASADGQLFLFIINLQPFLSVLINLSTIYRLPVALIDPTSKKHLEAQFCGMQ